MTLLDKIMTAIFGPPFPSLEEAEAEYLTAKERFDRAQERGDKRGMGQALPELNKALNHMLAVESGWVHSALRAPYPASQGQRAGVGR